ncbi:aldo/keto reductase [Falsibacillus albus]|uniref:Aldo/keto reductase n=1 Tax=Falsibacillus albus TaxID=2478915 RepID=A0A3L7K9S5_9BACI|nr:aldo/keto reductase [Falsibacillus albus]RLQ97392.1 aldo/keto reductase [Falsibacillus albus]
MVKSLQDTITLHNGVKMPYVGLGVWQMKDENEARNAVKSAIAAGYRSIDTAAVYENEESVGLGVKESSVPREDLFITSKVWNSDQGYDTTLKAFEASLKRLDMDYLDLYLIHWPVEGKYNDTWRAMEKLYADGLVKSIGVSNFHQHHLEDLLSKSNEKPVVNQVETHPRLNQAALKEYCKKQEIALEAWSPLGQGKLLGENVLKELGNKHNKTAAQVILRWHLQNDTIIIPKSVHENRIKENADLFDFELSQNEMEQINELNRDERFGPNPDTFDF